MWGMISGLVLAKKMKDIRPLFNAIKRPTYWINITGKPKLFAPLIDQVLKVLKRKNKIFFVSYFHPDELIDNNHSLYSMENMIENISTLIECVNNNGAKTNLPLLQIPA